MWSDAGGVEVGVASRGIDGVLLKVLTDVFRCGLRQQPVDALPITYNTRNTCVTLEDVCRDVVLCDTFPKTIQSKMKAEFDGFF